MTEAPEEKWLAHNGGLPTGNYPKDQLVRYIRADVSAARIADLERQLAEAREVKPLEWEQAGNISVAQTPSGRYAVGRRGSLWIWVRNGTEYVADTEAAAKAAAQADYEARILSALKGPTP